MCYQLLEGEPLPEGIKRIAHEEINAALNYLQQVADGENFDDAVHEARKSFKKLRGLLRLVRKEIGEEVYKRENICFRDAGRLLSDMRDKRVMIDVFEEVAAEIGEESRIDFENFLGILKLDYDETKERVIQVNKAPEKASEMLNAAQLRIEDWPIERNSFAAAAGGLRKVYRRGRNRFKDSKENPTAEALHEWRKRVKYLWYNIRILQPIEPEIMGDLVEEIDALGDHLGRDHDLAELRSLIMEKSYNYEKETMKFAVLSHIDAKRSSLQDQAFMQGAQLYAASPSKFVKTIGSYWG